jgi:RNA polymerase sigma-70 factor (ECF subfamily)
MAEPLKSEPQEQVTDAELMARVRAGDRDAFADLVERHKDAVVNYLTRLAGNRDRAEDLGQETFLRLYRAVAGYVEQGYLRAYLFRIATNLVRSEERRERRQRLLLPLLGGDPDRSEPLAHTGMLRQEMQRQLAAAVARLPLRYRVPLVLHEIEGWSYADVAAELDCREGTIKSRIHRGRQSLKRQLESYWYGGFQSWKRKN